MPEPSLVTPVQPELTLLFICTHNRCRSIMCEALARHLGRGRIAAFSAGSQPSGSVHPDTLQQLESRGIATRGLRSQSWDTFAELAPDALITVCDSAAGERCPLWLGQAIRVHWGLPDPSRLEGSSDERAEAFDAAMHTIATRLQQLLALELSTLRGDALRMALDRLADEEH